MCVTLASRKLSRFREDNAPPCDVMLHAESYGKRVTSHYPEICDATGGKVLQISDDGGVGRAA